jgi:hypothetical protein
MLASALPVSAQVETGDHWPVPCIELLANGGFESGGVGWNAAASPAGRALISAFNPFEGALGADLGGQDDTQDRLSQQVMLPVDADSIRLSFWWSLFTEEFPGVQADHLRVTLYSSDGSVLLASFLAADNDTTESWGWNPIAGDLMPYAGHAVQIRITSSTDGLNPTHFFVDSMSITACQHTHVYLPLVRR